MKHPLHKFMYYIHVFEAHGAGGAHGPRGKAPT